MESVKSSNKKETIVLYPSPGIGHLISMVELGKRLLLLHHPNTPFPTIFILITEAPYNTGSTTPYVQRVSSSHPSIIFHTLPSISLSSLGTTSSPHHETFTFRHLRLINPDVHQALLSISQTHSIRAIVLDFFCTAALQVAAQLNIPPYYYFTSTVNVLAVFLYLSTLDRLHKNVSFKDMGNTHIHVPGLPPIPPSDMIRPMLDRNDEVYNDFLCVSTDLPQSKGIIVNSFDALEPRALKSISDGSCVPDGPTPPIYCIGPLIATGGDDDHGPDNRLECLDWLDLQPRRSVVFLCFGSWGRFSAEQLKEMAEGLEKSGQRFLWVVRSPLSEEKSEKRFSTPPEPDLEALLPEGFLERTKGRGMVLKSWAPQLAVLSRESVGGFVTHCGWNSALEAIRAGVPMVAWPLYAEQHLNRILLVEELKLALPLKADEEQGLVKASELERRVRDLMESEQGKAIAQRIAAMKDSAVAAMNQDGSSYQALTELVRVWKRG